MRFLFIDANYPGFLETVYHSSPALRRASYERQMQAISAGLFGEALFQAAALRKLGHEAEVVITNAHEAQQAWAREHRVRTRRAPSWAVRYRRGLVPWPVRKPPETNWDIVVEQVRRFAPDVLYVEIMDSIPADVARRLVSLARTSIAQIAAPIPRSAFLEYDLVLSSVPSLVEEFKASGATVAYVPLAFEPSVLEHVKVQPRDLSATFVGSVGPAHPERTTILERIAADVPLQVWAPDPGALAGRGSIVVHGAAFGRSMYEVLGRSVVAVNAHAPWAGPDANNMRLFEATGMGALLVTDAKRNLGDLFDVGSEVVAYRSPDEAARLVRHFAEKPDEAALIAGAGQARTLRDHTWAQRMGTVLDRISP